MNRMEKLEPGGDLGMSLYMPHASAHEHLAFKLLRSGRPIVLSDALPLLEKMGVKVTDERPYEVRPREGPPVWIYDFGLQHEEGAEFQADDVRETFQDTFARVWRGDAESDGFNRLVLSARLTAREITVLRAIAKYLRQAGSTFSQTYMEDALSAHPLIARRLVELFRLRLDPARFEDTDAKAHALESEIEAAVDEVASLDEDRILRGFLRVVRAVLRTNYFQTDAAGQAKPYLSLKLDPELIPDLPEPRPLVEVFVYSPRVEAVHLRGGKVARGGIRWSDRREDFRTEVLGLMKAQTVKNAVIVPVGAKGGFVVKRPPPGASREELQAEVVECYRTFIRGLLDVTDTIAAGEIVPPPDVVRHDERRPVPRRRRRQGHGDVLRHRERDLGGLRLLARRRLRVGRLDRLRPQGDGDHGARRVGVGQAALPRARPRHRRRRLHRRRESATCRATCSATGCCCRGRSS